MEEEYNIDAVPDEWGEMDDNIWGSESLMSKPSFSWFENDSNKLANERNVGTERAVLIAKVVQVMSLAATVLSAFLLFTASNPIIIEIAVYTIPLGLILMIIFILLERVKTF